MTLIKPDLDAGAGWLSPDGKLYLCEMFGHDALALTLTQKYYSSDIGTKLLESHNWIQVTAQGELLGNLLNLTQSQIDTLFDIIIICCKNVDSIYCRNIAFILNKLLKG